MDPVDVLWEINNEYRKRLSQFMGHLKLLEQLLAAQGGARMVVQAVIRGLRTTLDDIDIEYHEWRHTYFYRVPINGQKRRMVNDPDAVAYALHSFAQMFRQHLRMFLYARETLQGLPRPEPQVTQVLRGNDLWTMILDGVDELIGFEGFLKLELMSESL